MTERQAARGKHRRPCSFCTVHPADLRDLDTGDDWCLGCARSLILAGDAITHYEEFDEGHRYKSLLDEHGAGLFTRFRSSDD